MSDLKTSTFVSPGSLVSWDEDRTSSTTPRVTPASVKFSLPSIKASIEISYLMTYLPDGNASFIFTDIVTCEAQGETEAGDEKVQAMGGGEGGSFVTQGKGSFDGKNYTVQGEFQIVEGSGTGGLKGVVGKGGFISKPTDSNKGAVEYSYDISIPEA
jgi:hypothetical protein